MPKFFQTEIASYGGEKNTFQNVKFKKNNLENSAPAVAGTVLEFIPVHIKNPPVIQFIAYIDSMSDKFGSQFSSEQPFGRTDPYYIWKSSKRDISINWALPSSSVAMGLNNMNNLSWLLGALYPTYKETSVATSIAASPLFRVRHANLISSPAADGQGLLCVIQGVNVTHDIKQGYIRINPKNMGSNFANVEAKLIEAAGFQNIMREGKKYLIPKLIKLSCTLNVLHDHSLGWDFETGAWRGPAGGFPYQIGVMREGTDGQSGVGGNDTAGAQGGITKPPTGDPAGQGAKKKTNENKSGSTGQKKNAAAQKNLSGEAPTVDMPHGPGGEGEQFPKRPDGS